jgi:hypothetical protein
MQTGALEAVAIEKAKCIHASLALAWGLQLAMCRARLAD